jgi:3-deoxy-D-manno-octulosonic acid kinase
MTNEGGQRIATAGGALLADPEFFAHPTPEALFEPSFWAARGELVAVSAGRGSAWFIATTPHPWALRHYRRGGCIARFNEDRYMWTAERRVRAFAEWRLLAQLTAQGLPVPKPVAARYRRTGLTYRCDLLTRRIVGAQPLSAELAVRALADATWRSVGAALARVHAAGVDHADLNAHNILLDAADGVSVIDFDRGKLRGPGAWSADNLARLQRSLRKICRDLPPDRFADAAWQALMDGYARPL